MLLADDAHSWLQANKLLLVQKYAVQDSVFGSVKPTAKFIKVLLLIGLEDVALMLL